MFFPVLLWIMPVLMAVAVVVYVERVKRMTSDPEDHSARYIFDSVSIKLEAMIDNKAIKENVAQDILETLINELVENGWDRADAALFHYQDIPFIVQAFANCGVKLVEE